MLLQSPVRPIVQGGSNLFDYSYNIVNGKWTQSGTAVGVLDAIGIFGQANTATTITDDNAAAGEAMSKTVSISNDSLVYVVLWAMKVNSDETVFPEFELQLNGGTTQRIATHINKNTGAIADRLVTGTCSSWVRRWRDWWFLFQKAKNNSSGNTSLVGAIYPSYAKTLGGAFDATANGSCIIGHAQAEKNRENIHQLVVTNGSSKYQSITRNIVSL